MRIYHHNPNAKTVQEFLEITKPTIRGKIKGWFRNFIWNIPNCFPLAQENKNLHSS